MKGEQDTYEAGQSTGDENKLTLPAGQSEPRVYYQQKDHGGLYEISTEGNGQIAIWPQGGGFQRLLSANDFANQYVVAPALIMRRRTVTAEFLAEDVVLI